MTLLPQQQGWTAFFLEEAQKQHQRVKFLVSSSWSPVVVTSPHSRNHPFEEWHRLIPFDNWPAGFQCTQFISFMTLQWRTKSTLLHSSVQKPRAAIFLEAPKEGNASPYSQQSLANCNSSRESSFCPCLELEWLLRRIKRRVGLLSVFPFNRHCCGCTLKRSPRNVKRRWWITIKLLII